MLYKFSLLMWFLHDKDFFLIFIWLYQVLVAVCRILVVACKPLVAACAILFPDQGLNLASHIGSLGS